MIARALHQTIHHEFPAARAGDRAAFTRLVAATQRMVTSVALALVRDVRVSEDIAQDTFLKAWQRLGRMEHPDSFLPWLRDVARHAAIDHLRARLPGSSADADAADLLAQTTDPQPGPEAVLAQAQLAEIWSAALDAIPARSREVLLLFYREGQRSETVAGLLGLSDGAVRKRLQRAREGLKEQVLARLAEAAVRSAPGAGFSAVIGTAIGSLPAPSSAAAVGAATSWTAAAPKALLGAGAALLAALGVMLGAVWIEVRGTLKRAASAAQRRALRHHGFVYAALMATYVVVLWWSGRNDWSRLQTVAAAAGFVVAILLLAWRRRSIERSTHDGAP